MRGLTIALLAAGCDEACDGAECAGQIFVDMSTAPPTFSIDGLGPVIPDALTVGRWAGGPLCTAGEEQEVWRVEGMPEDAMPVRYAEVPERSREATPAEPLVENSRYVVQFWARDQGLLGSSSASGDWAGTFVWGDPDSAQLRWEACSY